MYKTYHSFKYNFPLGEISLDVIMRCKEVEYQQYLDVKSTLVLNTQTDAYATK